MRRLATLGSLGVLVIAGGLLADRIDADLPIDRPVVLTGHAGAPVAIGQGAVTVHGATAATRVDAGGEEIDTDGYWIVVDASLRGVAGPIDDLSWWLEDAAGRRFEATDRVDRRLPQAQPGMSLRGPIVFEVAADVELTSATIAMTVSRYPQQTAIRVPIERASGTVALPDAEWEDAS
ncbi:hypothetical protein ACWDR7_12680 [Microbacterium sp. NPDC003461]|jgi:hypothetical protein